MFTGLVQHIGKIVDQEKQKSGATLTVKADKPLLKTLRSGDSIAMNGTCQTVEKIGNSNFQVFSAPETLKATNLGSLKKGSLINLELPLRPTDYIGGHFVQGHVEDTGTIKDIQINEKYWDILIQYRSEALLPKGSIALDGISLTIQKLTRTGFWVQVIQKTLEKTNITSWSKEYAVNIETDYLIKAVMQKDTKRGILTDFFSDQDQAEHSDASLCRRYPAMLRQNFLWGYTCS